MEMLARKWNSVMHAGNGNVNWIMSASQNLPGTLSSSNKLLALEELLRTKKPHVLAVIEPRHSELLTFTLPGYVLVKGMCKGV